MYGMNPAWIRRHRLPRNAKGREVVPVKRARALYDHFGCWNKTAFLIKRKDGTRFQALSVQAAVRRADLGQGS